MNLPRLARQAHRWLSVIFTLAVIVNLVALFTGQQATWIGFLALVPLILMMATGLYLFVLPYLTKGRASGNGG